MKVYYDNETSLDSLKDKKIAVLGYGSQGHAHALNLKDSGMNVCVGLRSTSASKAEAEKAGLEVKEIADATAWADVVISFRKRSMKKP